MFLGLGMAVSNMTDLESAVLTRMLAGNPGLPDISQLSVRSRKNTGAGRYTDLAWSGEPFAQKHVVSEPNLIIEMDGVVPLGLGVVVFVEAQELTLELFTYQEHWDGAEGQWRIKESADDR